MNAARDTLPMLPRSGVLPRRDPLMNAARDTLPMLPRSGVVPRPVPTEALVAAIELTATQGKSAIVPLDAMMRATIDVLHLARDVHWNAYARIAGLPRPSAADVESAIAAVCQKYGYWGAGNRYLALKFNP